MFEIKNIVIMGEILPDGSIQGYQNFCQKCGKVINVNAQGSESYPLHKCEPRPTKNNMGDILAPLSRSEINKFVEFIRENSLKEIDGKYIRQYEDTDFSKYSEREVLRLYSKIEREIGDKLMKHRHKNLPAEYLNTLRKSKHLSHPLQIILNSIR